MSNIIYQKLTEDKIDTFIQMRINQLLEEGATRDVDLAPALKDVSVSAVASCTQSQKSVPLHIHFNKLCKNGINDSRCPL